MPRVRSDREGIVHVCRRLHESGLIAGADGNVSVRLGDDRLLVTPSGIAKRDLAPEDLVEVTLAGEHIHGAHRASSEIAVHLRFYERRPDVHAVVHAHPPVATGFAVAGESLPSGVLPELICLVGEVPLVPFDIPGTEALARRFDPWLASRHAFLMANHGAVTVGESLESAHQRMESLEHAARIVLTARLLGRVTELTSGELTALKATRERPESAGAPDATRPESGEDG